MSPERATLLHSPGWNKGKARYGTLGTHRQKRIELRRSGTYPRKQMPQGINILRRKTTNRNDTNQMRAVSAAPTGLNKCVSMIDPGLAPWAMQEYRPLGAHCPTAPIKSHKQSLTTTHTITIKQIHKRMQQSIYTPKHI